MPDQEGLEAVAEALWRHAGFGTFKGEENFAERPESIREEYLAEARVALAASRQPVSGGPENREAVMNDDFDVTRPVSGDREAAAAMVEVDEWIAPDDDDERWLFLARAALSRVPADGEQPAGSTDLHELDLGRRGIIPPSPSDGPVSASRPPGADPREPTGKVPND